MAKAVLELEAVTGNWDGGIRKAQTALQNFIKTNGGLHSALAKDSQMMAEAIGKMGSMESKAATANARLRELESMFMELGSRFHEFTAAEKAGAPGQQTIKSMEELRGRILDVKKNMQDLQKQISLPTSGSGGAGFGQKFMQGLVPGFGMGAGMVGAMAALKAMNALKDVTVDTIRTNMEFEQSNANLAAILGKTTGEIYQLTENAKQLGGTTIFTASQISELQTVLSRRGFDEGQILNMTHGIANLAVATGTDLAQSAELAASTMQAFGMKATEMERIVSVLGVSTTKSALTTQALGVSLQYVAPTARAAGFSLEDTVAMLGALVDSGLDASTAGTSLRQIILGMSTANGKLANSFGHPIRGLKDFTESIKKLKESGGASLDNISKKVRVTAVPAFLSLVENADRLNELRDSITGVENELQTMADKQMDTAKGAAIMLKSAWEGLQLTFDESNGALKDGITLLTEWINKYKEWRQLGDGGQGAVNAKIGNEEAFRKNAEKRAEDYIQRWENNQMAATMRGGGAAGYVPGTGWGVDGLGVVWTSNISDYESPYAEAADKLKEMKELYEKLIPLSKQYADYKDGNVSPKTSASIKRWGEGREAKAEIESLTGQKWNYDSFMSYLTGMYKDMKMYEAVVNKNPTESTGGILVGEDENGGGKEGTVTIVERAKDVVANALRRYNEELEELFNRLGAGLIDQAEFDKRKLGLDENVWEAYGKANKLEPSAEYQKGMDEWLKTMKADADIAAKSGATKEMVDAEKKYARTYALAAMKEDQGLQDSIAANKQRLNAEEQLWSAYSVLYEKTHDPKYLTEMEGLAEAIKCLRQEIEKQEEEVKKQRQIANTDKRTLNGLMGIARSNKIGYDKVGIGGQMERIQAGIDIPDEEWQRIANSLNEELQKRGATWYISVDFESGTIEKLKTDIQETMEAFGSGIGAADSIVNAIDGVKSSFESMIETMQGDADVWDKMMSAWNAGMSVLQSIVTIYEAINTLKAVSAMLTGKETVATVAKVAADTADTEASGALAGTEVAQTAANEALAISSISAANAMMAEANAAKAAEYALIPGGIAALPGVLAALNGAYAGGLGAAKAASAIMYAADGGMAGNPLFKPRGTDTVPAMLSPGEIILNRAQQTNLAPQLQPSRALSGEGLGSSNPYVSGEYIYLGVNNYLRRTGKGELVTSR